MLKLHNKLLLMNVYKPNISFYPTNFYETFCNCAAEAQLYHTVCIYNSLAGLTSTIGDRGLSLNYDLEDPDYVKKTCNDVINLMNDESKK